MKIEIIIILFLFTLSKIIINKKFMNKICLIVRFKNERHILYEFIQHYILEEIDTIFLIDDNSDDNYFELNKEWLQPLIKSKKVIINKSIKNQVYDYNFYVKKFINYRWVLICDMDEFFFSVPKNSTLKSILVTQFSDKDYILIPWKLFTHNSKLQPKSVISNNVRTHSKLMDSVAVMAGSKGNKYIVRPNKVKYFKVHCCLFGKNRVKKHIFNNCHNNIIENNHYKTQSKEMLLGVKSSRGGGKVSDNKEDNKVSKKKYINYKNHLKFRYNKKCYKLQEKRSNLINKIKFRDQIRPLSFYYRSIDSDFDSKIKVLKLNLLSENTYKIIDYFYSSLTKDEILLLLTSNTITYQVNLKDELVNRDKIYFAEKTLLPIYYEGNGLDLPI